VINIGQLPAYKPFRGIFFLKLLSFLLNLAKNSDKGQLIFSFEVFLLHLELIFYDSNTNLKLFQTKEGVGFE
jgi:hypothetical protein